MAGIIIYCWDRCIKAGFNGSRNFVRSQKPILVLVWHTILAGTPWVSACMFILILSHSFVCPLHACMQGCDGAEPWWVVGQWKRTSSSACVQSKLRLEQDLTASTDHGEGRGVHGHNIYSTCSGPEVHTYSIFHLQFILQFNCPSAVQLYASVVHFAVRFCSSLLQFTFAVLFCSSTMLLQFTFAIRFCNSLLQLTFAVAQSQ